MTKKQRRPAPAIKAIDDNAYCALFEQAAATQAAVASMSRRIGDVLRAALALGIRRPNDWQFTYNGHAEFRWWNGEHYASSQQWLALAVFDDHAGLRGQLDKERNYSSDRGLTIPWLTTEDALAMLKLLVGTLDKETKP